MSGSHVYGITGGTGTLGTALTKALLSEGHKVRVYARNEHGHERLERSIPESDRPRLSCLVGAVEDRQRLTRALAGVDYVIHAAALKIVPICEYNAWGAIETNVTGSHNVIEACLDTGVKRAVLVSSDKASAPSTLYGASKLCAERLFLAANRLSAGKGCEFVACRYGNVFASQGSVVHAFAEQAQYGVLKLTDPESTRFHFRLDDAVTLVRDTLTLAEPGCLWIPKLPSYRLGDFARAFARVYELTRESVTTGLRPGEKRHESLISENESCSMKREVHDRHVERGHGMYVLEPGKVHAAGGWSYHSGANTWRLSVDQLAKEIGVWAGRSS